MLSSLIQYIVIAAVVATAFYKYVWPIVSIFVIGNVRVNKTSTLTEEEYKKISVGAMYISQQNGYQNTLKTGIRMDKIYAITGESWGINNKTTAEEAIESLLNKGSRSVFDVVYKAAFEVSTDEERTNMILSNIQNEEEVEKAFSQLHNLLACFEAMKEEKIVESNKDIKSLTSAAWDFGRVTFLARICYDAKFLSEDDAMKYINKSFDLTKSTFKNWQDFAKSYLLGRVMWGGDDVVSDGIEGIAEDLLKDENSPWIKMPL